MNIAGRPGLGVGILIAIGGDERLRKLEALANAPGAIF